MTAWDLRHAAHLLTAAQGVGYTRAPLADEVEWQLKGICRSGHYDPDLWSPTGRNPEKKAQPAIDICHDCPVMSQCAAWALKNHEEHGVWGGLSEADRWAIWTGQPKRQPYQRRRDERRRELPQSA